MSNQLNAPWFIWQERAMQLEGCDLDEINDELLQDDSFSIYSGTPTELTRSRMVGGTKIAEVDEFDFEDGRPAALAAARIIAAAPDLLDMVVALLYEYGGGDNELENAAWDLVARARGEKLPGGAT